MLRRIVHVKKLEKKTFIVFTCVKLVPNRVQFMSDTSVNLFFELVCIIIR